jgi:uridylate kinase
MSEGFKYKRVLLKLSGEMFGGSVKKGLDVFSFKKIASCIHSLHEKSQVELAIILGAGNLFRGRDIIKDDVDHATADYIGMLGTVMNALALQLELEKLGSQTRVMSSLAVNIVCEPFIRRRAIRHLEKGRIVILAGGTGSPFFTTDSAAALKACELNCEILLKGSNIEGVFSADPKLDAHATMYKRLNYQEALEKGLMVMDNTAFALCQREKVPIVVFNLEHLGNIEKILKGEEIGTLIA